MMTVLSSELSEFDMPKPLSRLSKVRSYGFGPGALVNERPKLALEMMRVLSHWPFVESEIRNLLVRIVGPESTAAIDGYIESPTAEARLELLANFRDKALSTEHPTYFKTLLSLFEQDHGDRKRLAHWLSGATPDHPDIMLLVNPAEYWRRSIEDEEDSEARELALQNEDVAAILKLNVRQREKSYEHEHILFYTVDSFKRLDKRFTDLIWSFSHFQSLLQAADAALGTRRLQRLLEQPRFAKALKGNE
jgi:hypothetical protein